MRNSTPLPTLYLVFLLSALCLVGQAVDPIVVFHGMGDQCSNPGMASFTKQLGEAVAAPSICLQIGSGAGSSLFMDFTSQSKQACQKLSAMKQLANTNISLVGLSQGALIARSIIQECTNFTGRVKKYISIGGPQMGVNRIPSCFNGPLCHAITLIADKLVYSGSVQNNFGPAGYFHNNLKESKYRVKSIFLSRLNNQIFKSESRYDRLKSVQMMLVKFNQDSVVHPRESEWFMFDDEHGQLRGFGETDVFSQDLLPLREMYTNNQIVFVAIEGDHLRFSKEDIKNTFAPFLQKD